ncbi:SIS domain-containing protein [Sphingomonas sp. LB-2]|uniref:SIS domain-containing protein n=1 Tax=Sphingomonas caeni TaxID=2984949 RepID=UPI002230D4AE|nr:SIS domain-containing protein [Sphingomonas caeni]MCW3848032.1 SIS domain-containing protein [Sphingomonas caeni]
MFAEAEEAGAAVARFLAANSAALERIGARLRADPPEVVVTCARGSSDHAATYGKYLIETLTGVVTASAALSVSSLYQARPAHTDPGTSRLCIAISQSGRSPDLLAAVEAQRDAGAFVIALVNDETSPLAGIADELLALHAGPERSVAATKSYIVSLAGLAALTAAWAEDAALAAAVAQLPDQLPRAFALDWSAAIAPLLGATSLFVIGRGYGFGVAQEAALKLKETCGLHAECFSAAEVKHGPMAIVGEGFPILAFEGSGAAGDDVRETAALFASRGATVIDGLPFLPTHPAVEPILMIASFYRMAERLAVARGFDPDAPPFLAKVTRTQ